MPKIADPIGRPSNVATKMSAVTMPRVLAGMSFGVK
jgi:hypothetical protein